MRNEKNPLVQGGIDSTFVFFLCVCKIKYFKIWGSGPSARASAGRVCLQLSEIIAYKCKNNKSIVYMFLTKGVVFVSNHVQESFSTLKIYSTTR